MKALLENLPSWINEHKKMVFGVYLLLFVVSIMAAGKITLDDSLESWFENSSSVFINKRQFEHYFGSNEDLYIVVKARDGDLFSDASLFAYQRLHDQLQGYTRVVTDNPESGLSHIREIRSLINEPVTKVNGDDLLIRPFIGDELPDSDDERLVLKQEAIANPDLLLRFVSENGEYGALSIKTNFGLATNNTVNSDIDDQLRELDFSDDTGGANSLIVAQSNVEDLAPRQLDYQAYASFMNDIRQTVANANTAGELEVFYTGLPELIAFQVEMQKEMGGIFLGLFVFIFVLSWALFRHLSAPVWTLTVIVVTLVLVLGFVGMSGTPMSSLSQAMILLVILISVADVVHLLSSYRLSRQGGFDHESAMSLAFSKAGYSCFLTTLTTVVGFSSLWIVKPSVPVANFGLMSAVGLIVAYLVSMTLLPLLMDFWQLKVKPTVQGKDTAHRVFDWIHGITERAPLVVLLVCGTLVLIVGSGASRLEVDTNTLEAFDEKTEIRQAFAVADSYMGGTQNMDLMIELGEVDAVYNGEVLRRMEQLQAHMHKAYPELIVTSTSIVNVLKQINQQLNQGKPEFYALPEDNGGVAQLLFLFQNATPEERKKLISEDFDATRISFGLKNAGSTEYVEIVENARAIGDIYFGDLIDQYPTMNIVYTGGLVAFVTLFDRITVSQVNSFLVTFIVIMITLVLVFRSYRLGLLAMVPSLVPVAITFGTMGWLGISLDSVTMIIAPIILGIAVDDSIHFIRKLQVVEPQSLSSSEALRKVLAEVGPALIFTSIILGGGLLTMLLSSNASFQNFGYLGSIAIFSALLADLIMIPAICSLKKKEKDLRLAVPS